MADDRDDLTGVWTTRDSSRVNVRGRTFKGESGEAQWWGHRESTPPEIRTCRACGHPEDEHVEEDDDAYCSGGCHGTTVPRREDPGACRCRRFEPVAGAGVLRWTDSGDSAAHRGLDLMSRFREGAQYR